MTTETKRDSLPILKDRVSLSPELIKKRQKPMPEKEIRKRGGAKRWRTIELGNGRYARVAVVRKAGRNGGHTVMGKIREKEAIA
jgi:hypothetical protein